MLNDFKRELCDVSESELMTGLGREELCVICAGCGTRIKDRYYLFVMDRGWHETCLTCCECGLHLGGQITCFLKEGNIFCRDDYSR